MATKRKRVAFADLPEEEKDSKENPEKRIRTFKDKHSLDSDEEDNVDDTGELDDEDLAHQEKSTISWDEGQKITPFNLEEELEEGRFDAHGNYYAKDDEDVADSWLDTVNWDKVKAEEDSDDETAEATEKPTDGSGDDYEEEEEEDENEVPTADEKYSLLKELCDIVKPGETVAGALRRLGTAPSRPKFRKGKPPAAPSDSLTAEERAAKRQLLAKLTDLADRFVQLGRMAVYEDTYEKFMFEMREHDNTAMETAAATAAPAVPRSSSTQDSSSSGDVPSEVQTAATAPEGCSEVCWSVRAASSGADGQVFGPFSSTQMNDWSENGTFGQAGILVRKAKETSGEFYSSQRIDFDLYVD